MIGDFMTRMGVMMRINRFGEDDVELALNRSDLTKLNNLFKGSFLIPRSVYKENDLDFLGQLLRAIGLIVQEEPIDK